MEGIEHGHGQKMRGLLYLMTVEFLAVVVGAVQCGLELVVSVSGPKALKMRCCDQRQSHHTLWATQHTRTTTTSTLTRTYSLSLSFFSVSYAIMASSSSSSSPEIPHVPSTFDSSFFAQASLDDVLEDLST